MRNRFLCNFHGKIHLRSRPFIQCIKHNTDDLFDILLRQCVEHKNLINSVDKLRLEDLLDLLHHAVLHLVIVGFCILLHSKAQMSRLNDPLCSGIGCHDNDRVLEADLTSLCIGHMTILQDLQQNIKYVCMRLLDLIK